jgi:hypothetical protein
MQLGKRRRPGASLAAAECEDQGARDVILAASV